MARMQGAVPARACPGAPVGCLARRGLLSARLSVCQAVSRSVGRCWEQRGSLKVGGFWHILPPYNTTTTINDRSYACIEDPKALNT